ncbi:hypothetical protein [Saccharopolyspora hattusasensis]|uniref:hypothetical protein n=1 Tax=Saccharopolyspora hattusasensis TaxID=1128679 RepID=UPI003D964E37
MLPIRRLRRLRTAAQVTLSVALAIAIMLPLLAWWGQPLPLAMIGAVVAINSSLGVNDPDRRQQQITNLLMPLPAAFALLLSSSPRRGRCRTACCSWW